MALDESLAQQMRSAARECARADWLMEQRLAAATLAGERLLHLQREAQLQGATGAEIHQVSAARVVVDSRTTVVDVVTVVEQQPWHRVLWPTLEAAVEGLDDLIPPGMDPEIAADRIAVHTREESTWGGVWLDCTDEQLRTDLVRHFAWPTGGLSHAC